MNGAGGIIGLRELAAVYHELQRRAAAGESDIFLSREAYTFLLEMAELAANPPQPNVASVPAVAVAEPVASPLELAQVVGEPPARPAGAAAAAAATAPLPPSAPQVTLGPGDKATRWQVLREQVLADPWCLSQVKPGRRVVFGWGNLDAEIFFCGEAPGEEEEIHGEPFVGPAGQLLTKIIQAMGLQRSDVYIGNILNYRPPMPGPIGNRPPTSAELAYCLPYLRAQIAIVQPKVIVALGKTAVDGLLGPDPKRRMTRIRGHWHSMDGIPVMPTFHPSYLLRDAKLETRRQVWEDMLQVMERIGLPISERQRGFFRKT